jgi:hypothetical protein
VIPLRKVELVLVQVGNQRFFVDLGINGRLPEGRYALAALATTSSHPRGYNRERNSPNNTVTAAGH